MNLIKLYKYEIYGLSKNKLIKLMKIVKNKKKSRARFRRIKSKFYKNSISSLKKTFFIIILLIILIILNFTKGKIKNSSEILDETKLSKYDHYKLLLPKKKPHVFKKMNKNEEIKLFKLEDSVDYKKMKDSGNNYIYHTCVIDRSKNENLYIREFVEHYLSIGVEKFYLGDDNPEDVENISDEIDDYIKKGIVDIEFTSPLNITLYEFYEYTFRSVYNRCKWFIIYDTDEFLEFNDKNMNVKTYLDMPVFDKCDSIKIHWMIYDDNNLLLYDKRPLKERLSHALPNNFLNIYHKSIVRGKKYNGTLFNEIPAIHQPNLDVLPNQCDALGNFERLRVGYMGVPRFKYGHIRHHKYKTAEEFALKMRRGYGQIGTNWDQMLDDFSKINNLTEEKLDLIEHIVNQTFPKYHKNKNIQ